MIDETARHLEHVDILRKQIGGPAGHRDMSQDVPRRDARMTSESAGSALTVTGKPSARAAMRSGRPHFAPARGLLARRYDFASV